MTQGYRNQTSRILAAYVDSKGGVPLYPEVQLFTSGDFVKDLLLENGVYCSTKRIDTMCDVVTIDGKYWNQALLVLRNSSDIPQGDKDFVESFYSHVSLNHPFVDTVEESRNVPTATRRGGR